MTGPSWLIDSKRIASKIKNASETVDPGRFKWLSNPTKSCPQCEHIIDNSDVAQEWPGLPRGVKFDPSDQELLWHLLAKVGKGDAKTHPFINEFIPIVDEDDGICYTHPQKLPGVKQDGSVSHFFHRTFKAYNTGTRKRRKIHNDDLGDVRWHKTGKTKPVIIDGKHLGCKKIMVLYMSPMKGEKPEKTNWVMHQYHLGTGEDEQDGEFVVSKIFYQQQFKPNDKGGQDSTPEMVEDVITQVDMVAGPNLVTPEHHAHSPKQTSDQVKLYYGTRDEDNSVYPELEKLGYQVTREGENSAHPELEKLGYQYTREEENSAHPELEHVRDQDNHPAEDTKWWEGESQFLLDSQQLAEGIGICDEFLQSQSSCAADKAKGCNPSLSDYARMRVENLKKDLDECQTMDSFDHANIELDTPPDFRLSQLEFGSQDSFLAWAGSKLVD